MDKPQRGLRPKPALYHYIPLWRHRQLRKYCIYAKARLDKINTNQWEWFAQAVEDFNDVHARLVRNGMTKVLDESMSAWRPRKDKLGGLPNISYIFRKPKPLGTEFKTMVDADTGVMVHLEVQEGKDAMRSKEHHAQLGATAACCVRLAGGCARKSTVVGDAWFGSVNEGMRVCNNKS